jgi:hypothetical protein
MDLVHVSSSNLDSVGYDIESKTLRVKFCGDGSVYDHFGVPESKYVCLVSASSKGSYYSTHIKNKYRYRKVS